MVAIVLHALVTRNALLHTRPASTPELNLADAHPSFKLVLATVGVCAQSAGKAPVNPGDAVKLAREAATLITKHAAVLAANESVIIRPEIAGV